jgi:hypothetical protein
MHTMPVERRKWFIAFVGLLGLGAAAACVYFVHAALPGDSAGARVALAFLLMGAASGFVTLLNVLLPLVLVRLWPALDGPPA